MFTRKIVPLFLLLALAVGLPAFSMTEGRFIRPPTPPTLQSTRDIMSPPMLSSGGDTVWIQAHNDSSYCPGDPLMGHGGEATGGPGPMETWCFEGGPGDSCGTNPPWDVRCFWHEDALAKPSPAGINYWHVDAYRADQRAYCGNYALWCGSDSTWEGEPVDCGTWQSPPGYGDEWNCIAQLTLPGTFGVANGCTLLFDPRYDTECKYDYFYIDMWDGDSWVTLATFNATSNNPGDECGAPSGGNPDFWGNTDIDRLTNVDWQERPEPTEPAFMAAIDPGQYSYTSGPRFRWRFVSDNGASDASGVVNTDGAAHIDNVWVRGDSTQYEEDFESGTLDAAHWSLPDPDGIIDQWHIVHDPDPPYEGGDGGDPAGCSADSSYVYRARPEGGYPVGVEWRNGWYYRLITPSIPVLNSGCVVQYDAYQYASDVSCDYPDELVRFFDGEYGQWCPWINVDYELFWFSGLPGFDINMDVTSFMSDRYDSMQFAWYLADWSQPGDFCRNKHRGTDFQVDNVSVGFYEADASLFWSSPSNLLHDTFLRGFCGFNSGFDARNVDTMGYYWHEAHDLPRWNQLNLTVRDTDQISSVDLLGSIDQGASWQSVPMTIEFSGYDPYKPRLEGDCHATLCPSDFGLVEWDVGTTLWYCAKATDDLSDVTYFPAAADPVSPGHTGTAADYFTFSVLPLYPDGYSGTRVLLVNGYRTDPYYWAYDWAECLADVDTRKPLVALYGETLTDAGYCYDVYDIGGAGMTAAGIHPTWFDYYNVIIWFTGNDNSNNLIDGVAQRAIRDYLGNGGKMMLCGDRLAINMELCPPDLLCGNGDSLGGDFIYGIMGCDYIEEVDTPFSKPYLYCRGVDSVSVFGVPTQLEFDSLLVYRECPYPREMSWVRAEANPPAGFVVQPLLEILNPDVTVAHGAMYTEYQFTGQCVFINFDLSASMNHEETYCTPSGPVTHPFNAGSYEGRVDLMRLVLEDLFGLSPSGGGTAGTEQPQRPSGHGHAWALAQNAPNPFDGSTEIRYEVAAPCRARITVYNTLGQIVRVLADLEVEPGIHTVAWDGTGTSGKRLSSGVYFLRIEAGNFAATRKLLLLD